MFHSIQDALSCTLSSVVYVTL